MMILELGFTGVPFFNEDVKKEAESRGHRVFFSPATALSVDVSSEGVHLRANGMNLTQFDVIHVGSLLRHRWPIIAALGYLSTTNRCSIIDERLVNSRLDEYSGLSKYFLEYQHNINLPRSIVFKKIHEIKDRLNEFTFPVIIKNNRSRQGKGVGLAKDFNDIQNFVNKNEAEYENVGFILREFIPNNGDYRVNVIDGKAVTCLKRTPTGKEFRSNISLGGILTDTKNEDVEDVKRVAEQISKVSNYDIAGVDVMVHKETGEPYILEVNRAPGSLEDDVEASGVDLAKLIVDLYEKRFAQNRSFFHRFFSR